jgi:hypothetical protein
MFSLRMSTAEALTRELIPFLRSYGLVLNESKCVVIPKGNLITEQPDLEGLFNKAISEVSKQIKEDEFDVDYGFQSEWKEEDESDDADKWLMIQLKATETLFSSIENYPNQEDNIERFCLPLFGKAGSAYAVEHVLDSFKSRPAMAQIYVSYLAKFMAQDKVRQFLVGLLADLLLADWQKLWVLAALLQSDPVGDQPVISAMKILKDANRHDALRAAAAIYVGRYGDLDRRKALVTIYAKVSSYIQGAIYYSSRYWFGVERSNAKANWGGHGPINSLLTVALGKKDDDP